MSKLKQNGYCNFCSEQTGDKYYIFCNSKCQERWITFEESGMNIKRDIDKELYIKWFEEKTLAIEAMTKEQIEERIYKLYEIEFFAGQEWSILHKQWDKLTGRHGIPPWLKAERDKLITDPHIKVDWEGTPVKKEKKPKQDLVGNLLGIDMKGLIQSVKEKNQGFVAPEKIEKPNNKQSLNDALSEMLKPGPAPEPKPKLSEEELKKKAEEVKEKIRLAKEKREKGQ